MVFNWKHQKWSYNTKPKKCLLGIYTLWRFKSETGYFGVLEHPRSDRQPCSWRYTQNSVTNTNPAKLIQLIKHTDFLEQVCGIRAGTDPCRTRDGDHCYKGYKRIRMPSWGVSLCKPYIMTRNGVNAWPKCWEWSCLLRWSCLKCFTGSSNGNPY